MSQENVELVQAGFEAWNAGDMDGLREVFDPDVIARMPEGWPESGPFVGREAVMRQWEQQRDTWDADALEPINDFIDAADRVVVRFIWRGAGHGPESNIELTAVYTVRNRRVFYVEHFWDHAEALEALGLREQATSQENVEVVRRIFDAWASGDWSIGNEYLDQHAVYVISSDFPAFGAYFGLDGIRAYWRDFLEQYERLTFEAKRIEAVGDTVLAHLVQHAKGRASGIEGDLRYFMLFTFRGRRIVRMENIIDEGKALEAVGLSE